MARVRGVYLREVPKGPSAHTSKEAALAAHPEMVVADAAFPKDKMTSVQNAAFRVNSGGRGEFQSGEYFAIWEYATDLILRVKSGGGEGAVDVVGFEKDGEVIGEDGKSVGKLDDLLLEEDIERGGWVLLIGRQPNVPEGWEDIVSAPGSRKRKRATKGDGSS